MRHLITVLLLSFLVVVTGCSRAAMSSGGITSPSLGGGTARSSEGISSAESVDAARSPDSERAGAAPGYSPSLGTEWGEKIESKIDYVQFERADERKPDAVATIHYDDASGTRALIGRRKERSRPFRMLNGDIEFGLTDEEHSWASSYLPGVERNGKYFVRGESGDRYAIYVKNRSDRRVEFVMSVDGVDVMNGRQANFDNRGYVIEPGESFKVEGFRDSSKSVAAFRFSDVGDSYVVQKTGDGRNVGVIGIAAFEEKEDRRYAQKPEKREWRRRQGERAQAFPGEYATAP